MVNFCTNCGTRIRKEDNFCTNCGTKIDKSDMKQNNHLKSVSDSKEKENAKKELRRVVGGKFLYNKTFSNELVENGLDTIDTANAIRQQVEKEIDSGQIKSAGVEFRVKQLILEYKIKKEEENKQLKTIDETFKSEEIRSQIRKNNITELEITPIKLNLKRKIIDNNEKMSEEEIKFYIKTELKKEINKKENEKKTSRIIDEVFNSEEIRLQIRKNNIDQIYVISIKDRLKNKLINEKENMSEGEIKYFIKTELEKASRQQEKSRIAKEKEISSAKIEENKIRGNYCDLSCAHCYEEFLDSGGAILGDFSCEGLIDYYCDLGHLVAFGSFCKDYE